MNSGQAGLGQSIIYLRCVHLTLAIGLDGTIRELNISGLQAEYKWEEYPSFISKQSNCFPLTYIHHIYLRAVGRKVLWSSACVCLCVCVHSWAMLATASAQVCVPLGHSSLYFILLGLALPCCASCVFV